MTTNNFDYEWDERMHNGMGGWRITEHVDQPSRDADDFLTALKDKLS